MYKIIRIKLKISYHAWQRDVSVKSLIFKQIEKSYFALNKKPKMSRICVNKILSADISYTDTIKIITNNLNTQKSLNEFKKSRTMRISSNVDMNLENAIKFIDSTKATRSTIKMLSQKICRLSSLIPLLLEYNKQNTITIALVQLMNEREHLERKLFELDMKFRQKEYYRISRQLTQEELPMSYQFYSFLIPLIYNLSLQCQKLHQSKLFKC